MLLCKTLTRVHTSTDTGSVNPYKLIKWLRLDLAQPTLIALLTCNSLFIKYWKNYWTFKHYLTDHWKGTYMESPTMAYDQLLWLICTLLHFYLSSLLSSSKKFANYTNISNLCLAALGKMFASSKVNYSNCCYLSSGKIKCWCNNLEVPLELYWLEDKLPMWLLIDHMGHLVRKSCILVFTLSLV